MKEHIGRFGEKGTKSKTGAMYYVVYAIRLTVKGTAGRGTIDLLRLMKWSRGLNICRTNNRTKSHFSIPGQNVKNGKIP